MIKKLRKRFIRITMIAVSLVLLLLCLIVNAANIISVNSDLEQMLTVICDNQGRIPSMPPDGKPGDAPDSRFTMETPYSTRYFVLRYDDDGSLTGADLDNIAAVTEDDTGEYLDIAISHGDGFGYTSGYKYYVVTHSEGRHMAIFLNCYQELRSAADTAILSLAAMTVCIALVYVIVLLLSRRAIDPVVSAYEKQKQFITDASHELKTPITVIATSLKVLEMETGKQKWIDKAMNQTEKLKELVNSLVTLSKMDEEDSPLKFAEFDLSGALSETADSFSDFADSMGHTLSVDIEPGVIYNGDEYAVRQLASILLDNAIKYASPNTPVVFLMKKTKKGAVIRTENMSEPIPSAELDKLFDRFYRADKSRSEGSAGFGIGLSIARSIAEGHRGSIRAESLDGKNVCFTAELK